MIFGEALKVEGLSMLAPDTDTGDKKCPLCLVAKGQEGLDENWIQGASDTAAGMVARLREGPVDIRTKGSPPADPDDVAPG